MPAARAALLFTVLVMRPHAERALPTGEVTMLFTDIEGSTRLVHELGDRYGEVLAVHRNVLRDVWRAHRGVEVGVEGDSFFVAFQAASDAVQAAAAAQRALAEHAWPYEIELRVRMGVHTGSPRIKDGDYWGMDVHRAARVMSVAFGGQVLLSGQARAAADNARELLDLGHHRLKDLPAPEHLFQLLAPGLREEFPTLRSLNRSNLPADARRLVDRVPELALIRDLLTERSARLVTLTGTSGTGKTRLGTSAAASLLPFFPGGVFFVGLADLDDPGQVLGAIAEAAEIPDDPGETIEQSLADVLGKAPTLLLLDNFERLRPAAADIGALLSAAPELRVLATSQAPLRLSAEHVLPLGPLEPEHAVSLFAERVGALVGQYDLDEDSSDVAELCERLDHLPLAIELAAARAPVLGTRRLLERIDKRLDLLRDATADRPSRHQSLRAAVESSYELLADEDRAVFIALALFVAPFSIDDAEGLIGSEVTDSIERLLDHSFLRRLSFERGLRFAIAQALREFAFEELERMGELDSWRRRHAQWALAVAESDWAEQSTQPTTVETPLALVYDDLRAALSWASSEDQPLYLRLAGALGPFWENRGLAREGREHLRIALGRANANSAAASRALQADATLAAMQGQMEESLSLGAEAIAAAQAAGDPVGEVMALVARSEALLSVGRHDEARDDARRALELSRRRAPSLLDRAVLFHAYAEVADGQIERIEPMLRERIAAAPGREDLTAVYLSHLHADCALQAGDYAAAAHRYARAAELARALGAGVQTAFDLQGVAMALAGLGRATEALEIDAMADALIEELDLRETAEWWERLRSRHLEPARRSLSSEAVRESRELGSERPGGERVDRALELVGPIERR
jgi:predicted ATPase/class 3 adenylate cyclase